MLIDTNILVYSVNLDSPKYKQAISFISENIGQLEISHQNILEAIRVLTHKKFSHPKRLREALSSVLSIAKSCSIISPNTDTYYLVIELIKKYKMSGNRIFDAYLAATALSNGVTTIATDNTRDFKKFKGIRLVNPFVQESKN